MIANNNRKFIVFSDTEWDWSADYVRQTCMDLSSRGKVYCMIWNNTLSIKEYIFKRNPPKIIYKPKENITVFTPLFWIPFKRFKIVHDVNLYINTIIFLVLTFSPPNRGVNRVVWVFHPFFYSVTSKFRRYYHQLVFDLVDNFVGAKSGREKYHLQQSQNKLAQHATVVTANSLYLHQQLVKHNSNTVLVPQGFDELAFKTAKKHKLFPSNKPIIGYVGGINNRIDFKTMIALAQRHPEWEFWFWGKIQPDNQNSWQKEWLQLTTLPNCKSGSCDRDKLAQIYSRFSVGIIPYDTSKEFNKYCHPMKIFEYFYFGKPVVASSIYELSQKKYDEYVIIADNLSKWEKSISDYIRRPLTISQKTKAKKFAISQSWIRKIDAILSMS
jgi:glycosyltransferase involved in cell wall biosynthesis